MRTVIFSILFYMLTCIPGLSQEKYLVYRSPHLLVMYQKSREKTMEEVVDAYPVLLKETETLLGLKLGYRPEVWLVTDEKIFFSGRFAGFARPDEKRILINHKAVMKQVNGLDTTLKHEIIHLILHENIAKENLPAWLDEGIAQWATDGFSELLVLNKGKTFKRAAASGNLFSFHTLSNGFPGDIGKLSLAYGQSLAFIEYLEKNYGKASLFKLIGLLSAGKDFHPGFQEVFGKSLTEMENQWKSRWRKGTRILAYLSLYIYEICFTLAGLATIFGFIRLKKKKKRYAELEEALEEMENQKWLH